LNKIRFFNGAGSVLVLTCNPPYAHFGSLDYVCSDEGEWIGNLVHIYNLCMFIMFFYS